MYEYTTETEQDNVMDMIKAELNRKLELARLYGYPEYADEIIRLVYIMDTYNKTGKIPD